MALAKDLRARLGAIPGVRIQDLGRERCGIVTFTADGWEARALREALAEHRINVSTSTRLSTRLDMEDRGLTELVRASVHYYNSERELERFCRVLESVMRVA